MMLSLWRPARAPWPLLALFAPVLVAGAQQVRGTIVDSLSRTPVVGAVVETLDSTGVALSRGLTDEFGAYAIGRSAGVRRLRVVRMGYRPRDVEVAPMIGVEQRVDLAMAVVPRFLEAVSARVDPNCPRRGDSQRAFGLLEQARAGLMATVVSRQVSRPAIKIIRYERRSEGEGQRILQQAVRLDSSDAVATSFSAVLDASRFVVEGFIGDSAGTALYYGPDADVMLHPAFAASYCFRVRNGRNGTEIGLGFTPARSRRGRTDIEGTLWIDTVAKVVSQIEFEYIGVPRTIDIKPGGVINFRAAPNGSVMIDRWYFRMMDLHEDTASGAAGDKTVLIFKQLRESGGEVAWAKWPDGHSWKASLATVRLKVTNKFGEPVTRAVMRLTDSDYLGSPDSTGTVEFRDVLPGPYDLEMQDSALVSQHIIIKSATHFYAERDRLVLRTVIAPPAYVFFKQACFAGATGRWIEYHATDEKAHAVTVKWELGEDFGGRVDALRATGVTLRDGVFGYCRDLDERASLMVKLTRLDDATKVVIVPLPVTVVNMVIPVTMRFSTYANR